MQDFLTARWINVILLTYRVDPALLRPRLPPNCRLDAWDGHEGYVSLVAFDFLDTRVKGIGWPLFGTLRSFPEINLRFYVRHTPKEAPEERGVCFIREFVPSRLVAGVARWVYNEPYRAAPMHTQTREDNGTLHISHRLHWAGKEHRLAISAGTEKSMPESTTAAHFFKEHQWGFGMRRDGSLLRYEVVHPHWHVRAVNSWKLDWDWAAVYGKEWSPLQDAQPFHVMVAEGSAVRVMPKQ